MNNHRAAYTSIVYASTLAVLLALLVPIAAAQDAKLTLGMGYDDNLFRFNKRLEPSEGLYQRLRVTWNHTYRKTGTSIYAYASKKTALGGNDPIELDVPPQTNSNNLRSFDRPRSDADTFSGRLRLRQSGKFKLFGNTLKPSLDLTYRSYDKSYVSRTTGHSLFGINRANPVQYPGLNIKNRYDYDALDVMTKLAYRFNKRLQGDIYIAVNDRDYFDYSDILSAYRDTLSISNLSYKETNIGTIWRYRIKRKHKILLSAENNLREFDDRRERTLEASSIDNTDLQYQALRLRFKYDYKMSARWLLTSDFSYEERTDKASGYYDWTKSRLSSALSYSFSKRSQLTASITNNQLDYPKRNANNLVDEVNEAEYSAQDGFSYKLAFNKKLSSKRNVKFYSSLRFLDYDSNDDDYIYQRTLFESGFVIEL